jgi:cyanophycinase
VLLGLLIAVGSGVVATLAGGWGREAAAAPPEEATRLAAVPGAGSLVICGGGDTPESVRDHFLALAGGPRARILVIPTAHRVADTPDASSVLEPWRGKEAASVQLFHTRSRDAANDAEFARPLAEATGVWFSGGQQHLLTQSYLGTEVERQLKALLERGGVIGGTSAGAAVMTRVMITRGWRGRVETGQGFDLLPGAVVDQHFLRRDRLGRLLAVLADHPDLVGLGIDERTAVVVRFPNLDLNVVGDSYVVACAATPADNHPRLEILRPGDRVSLLSLRDVIDPALASAPAVEAGSQ